MIRIEQYQPAQRSSWDAFVQQSRNGVFLFLRGYMDYHADRFSDHSLMFHSGSKLVAVLPASESEGQLHSHAGLTFGGMVSGRHMSTAGMVDALRALRRYMQESGLQRLHYKAVPHIYHDTPAEEDLYALVRVGARLVRRDVSTALRPDSPLPVTKGRKSALGVGARYGIAVGQGFDFERFMDLETEQLLRRHGVRPVHTGAEMKMLAEHLPSRIKLYEATLAGELLAGMVVYESRHVAHAQYIAASARGRDMAALDLLVHWLLTDVYRTHRFFDFGISTEDHGRVLNEGLVAYKESYGARAIVHDFYELAAED
jgi:hypothetical protein